MGELIHAAALGASEAAVELELAASLGAGCHERRSASSTATRIPVP
jgi:hypothetical protein